MTHPRTLGVIAVAAVSAVVVTACGTPHYLVSTAPDVRVTEWSSSRITPHVVLVSIDGLRPDAIAAYETPTLSRLVREGSYTLTASTILPSKTLPSHTSMLTGLPPERHGVLWNTVVTADADLLDLPTVFGVARARGYETAAFFSKPKFQPLQQPGTLDYSQAPGGWFGGWSAARTVRDAAEHLAKTQPNLLFVHLSDPDNAGHRAGWMSEAYGRAVEDTDEAIADLLVAADAAYGAGEYTLIVTADHGGHGFDHGTDDPRDVLIPWIAWGRGVSQGHIRDVSVDTIDTASTVLWLLGVAEPADWPGAPVVSAFQAVVAVD
jgi:predicted AlkP superfamily pyrophosphatase or phosphodiesterase